MTIGKLFHLLITLKLKKFLLISRLHCFELRFILHGKPCFSLSCVYRPCKPCTFFNIIMFMENLPSLDQIPSYSFFQCGSSIRIRICIKIKWILSTASNLQFMRVLVNRVSGHATLKMESYKIKFSVLLILIIDNVLSRY